MAPILKKLYDFEKRTTGPLQHSQVWNKTLLAALA